jgi:hypothetical protein
MWQHFVTFGCGLPFASAVAFVRFVFAHQDSLVDSSRATSAPGLSTDAAMNAEMMLARESLTPLRNLMVTAR